MGLDPCLLYCTLESLLGQISSRGDLNVASLQRHHAAVSGVALASADAYVYAHDVMAAAAEYGQLHSVLQPGDAVHGSMSMPI